MSLIEYIILFCSAIIGGLLYFLIRTTNSRFLKLSLTFSGSYLFVISIVLLLPNLYLVGSSEIGYYVLAGFFIQLLLDYFSQGIEHGHIHHHSNTQSGIPVSLMIGLCIHSFLEGMPLASHFNEEHQHDSLLAGIILHHMPVAFALVSILADAGIKKSTVIALLFVFALMTPAGALLNETLYNSDIQNLHISFDKIMGIVIGIFLHISTTILFETGSDHKYNRTKIAVIALGATAALLI